MENIPIVSTDDGGGMWYPQACKFLKLEHHLHSLYDMKRALWKERYNI
jgi:hypothetical protein